MKFTHLHVHSHYSLLDGLPKIDQLLDYVKESGMDSVALTDHGVLYGAIEFYKKAKKKGIKPIIGCEAYLALERMSRKQPNIDEKRHHLVFLVKNEKGYKNLVKLITAAHLEGFYYKPRIDEEILKRYSEGLIALSACPQGKIPRLIMQKKMKEAEETCLKYREIFGKGNFYLELQHHPNIPEQKKVNQALIAFSKKLGLPLVCTNDSHYLKPEDAEAQDILMLINTGADKDDPERLTMKSDDFSLRKPEQMIKDFADVPEAVENTQRIVEKCNFDFELGGIKLPYYPLPEKKTADQCMKELCYEGLQKKNLKKTKEVVERLEYELSVIKQTGFAPYFLIVQDFVNWAKENLIMVGPGRGSAAGSLASYCLGITNVNPLKYNLLFERFINPDRVSPPDIDLDFTDRRRDEVIEYVAQKYGRDKVAQIITFGTMAARAVVRDVGRALGYTYSYCDQIAKMIPFGFSLDQTLNSIDEFRQLYQSDNQAQRLIDLAKKLEGVARHASTHACGVVISREPLENIVPLQHPTQNDETIVTQYEMHAIEDLGLLKMDFLGLKNLTTIEDTLKMIYAIHKNSIDPVKSREAGAKQFNGVDPVKSREAGAKQFNGVDIEKIPFDDKKVYQLLQKGNTVGVFQLESDGMQRYLKELKPTEFEDIIAMVALYRPGPMRLIPDYIARKHKKKKIEYLHPKLEPILKNTYAIPVYQEQIMKIAQELAGFTLAEADVLRKAIGKKIKKLLMEQKDKFIEGCVKNRIDRKIAQKIWTWIEPNARYSFNRSHAASYATIAYQTAYLKTHHPLEFMAALLTSEKADVERIGILIEECKKMGIDVLPPDINESFRHFSAVPGENKIRFGLLAIKNVGTNIVESIVRERKEKGKFGTVEDFIARISSKDLNKKSLESLIKAGAFDKLAERNQLLSNLDRLLEAARENQKTRSGGQKGLFDGGSFNSKLKMTSSPPASPAEKLKWEKELLGLYVSGHPLQKYEKTFEKERGRYFGSIRTLSIAEVKDKILAIPSSFSAPVNSRRSRTNEEKVRIGGIISGMKKIITKTGKPMLFLKLGDLTGKIEVVAFPSVIERNPAVFQEDKIVFVSGRTDLRDNVPKIIADNLEEIIEE